MTHGCYRCRMHCVTDETQSSSYNFLARPTPHRILADPETCRGRAPGSVQILFLSLLELLLTSLPGGSGASTPGHVRIETPSLDLGRRRLGAGTAAGARDELRRTKLRPGVSHAHFPSRPGPRTAARHSGPPDSRGVQRRDVGEEETAA